MTNGAKADDNQIRLYTLLIDQLQKYNTIIWQVPTALIAANFFVIDKFCSNPYPLLALSIFDAVLIYAFYRMVTQQRAIICAAKRTEAELKKTYDIFIPNFSKSKVRAPRLFVITLAVLNAFLFAYAIYIIIPNP